MFREGDYIVQLHESRSQYLLKNHIYQQDKNSITLTTAKDSKDIYTSSCVVFYSKPETWRYATSEEIEEYNRIGKPYDVTTLIKKFEVGKWYKFKFGINKYYLKCVKLDNEYFYYDEGYSFALNKFRNYEGQWQEKNKYPVKEISLEEIQQYLPEGHPDKIEKSLVGRYFKALKKNIQGSCTIIGNYYKIIEEEESCIKFYTEQISEALFGISKNYFHTIELMPEGFNPEEEEIPMNTNEFQIGDELEAIGNWGGFNAKAGSKAIVISNRTDTNDNFFARDNKVAVDIKWIEIIDSEGRKLSLNQQSNGLYYRENFRKVEFKLPKKWYVKATKENEEVLRQWRGSDHTGWKNDLCVSSDKYWELVSYCSKQGFVEITYEQFQKYVLKKQEYPLTPKKTFKSEELIIPQLKKEKIKIDFDLSTNKVVDIQVNLPKKQTKQVKQIKIEKFNLSL